jgi:hypothetical protein
MNFFVKKIFSKIFIFLATCLMQLHMLDATKKSIEIFTLKKLKIQFPCSFKNSDQFKILIGFHTHIYISPPPTSKSSGGRCVCVCVGPVRMAKEWE